ncbi:MAG: hypothetical protein IJW32_01330 [Clostridia bacterium]|nr:hypothetical protein [Clostridia bacterium]
MAVYYNSGQVQRVTGGPIPNANFVIPAADHKTKLSRAITNFVTNYSSVNADTFAREILSAYLGRMGLRSGVTLFPFKPYIEDRRIGFFNGASNSIALREELLKDRGNICLAVHTLAHEARHKYQQDLDLSAKYFTPYQPYIKVGDNPIFTSLCGFDRYEDPYIYHRIERDAYVESSRFTKEFCDTILAQLPAGSPHAEAIKKQISAVRAKDAEDLRRIQIRERDFSKIENVESFYNKAMPVFDSALALAREYDSGRSLSREGRAFADKLSSEFEFGGIDVYSRAISTMGIVLGRLPQREKVDEYLNFATSCKDPNKMPQFVSALVENAVPFTQQDYARLMLCTDYYKGRNITCVMPMGSFAKIGEATWVNTMLLSHGREATAKYVAGFKNTPEAALIDFKIVDKMISEYPQTPLLKVGNTPIYGCSEVLDFALKRCMHDKRIGPNEYHTMRAQCSYNLSNIMNHFGYCNPTNPDFTRAIFEFANNPFIDQFPPDPTPPNEQGTVFSQSISENLANYFEELRLRKEQERLRAERGEGSEDPDPEPESVSAAKKEFLAGLEKLKGSMSKEQFAAYIKSLGLSDCSRMPNPLGEDSSREIEVDVTEDDLLALGLTDEEVAELGLSGAVGDVSVIDVLQGAGKVVVHSETLADPKALSEVDASAYAESEFGAMPVAEGEAELSAQDGAMAVKPEAAVPPVAVPPEA